MQISSEHNLNAKPDPDRPWGIRVTLNDQDPFRNLIDPDWEAFHWFATESERDQVLEDMRSEHRYSRIGDKPSLVFERVSR